MSDRRTANTPFRRSRTAERAREQQANANTSVLLGPNRLRMSLLALIGPVFGLGVWLATGSPQVFGAFAFVGLALFLIFGARSPVAAFREEHVWIRNYRRHRNDMAMRWEDLTLVKVGGWPRRITFVAQHPQDELDYTAKRAFVPWFTSMSTAETIAALRPYAEAYGFEINDGSVPRL